MVIKSRNAPREVPKDDSRLLDLGVDVAKEKVVEQNEDVIFGHNFGRPADESSAPTSETLFDAFKSMPLEERTTELHKGGNNLAPPVKVATDHPNVYFVGENLEVFRFPSGNLSLPFPEPLYVKKERHKGIKVGISAPGYKSNPILRISYVDCGRKSIFVQTVSGTIYLIRVCK